MDKTDFTIGGIFLGLFIALLGMFITSYQDSSSQRQCREKLAVAPAQFRSAADIALICK